jgi:hypothetical protein
VDGSEQVINIQWFGDAIMSPSRALQGLDLLMNFQRA